MVSTTINFSGLMCLVLALGPANVLSAPQLPALPFSDMMNQAPETTDHGPGNSETSAGSGVNVGIPDGPFVNAGAGFHDSHRGPCGPASGSDQAAGAGVNVGIPGGPSVNVGNGMYHHEDGYPCPEPPVVVPTTTTLSPPVETAHPPTWTVPTIFPPPTFTTPISVPLTTAPPAWAPSSTPLIRHPAPTASASPSAPVQPVFNAGSALLPGSVFAVALPVILAFFN
ncbi:hypothetical protein N7530_007748 [Penicillium desertorum]|uniref:Uncharacterized protein n=1 Tax=Penicillium desertorum TaxID=1303715 RepID=A0A9X0BK79_9EURO|nr:hypothetical protein N7530_007748 [Penicillium desertorum]